MANGHVPTSPEPSNRQEARIVQVEESTFMGPLPHPSLLEQYERITPGLASKITAMAEENGKHRRTMEKRMLWAAIINKFSGQVLAFLIVAGGMTVGVYLLLEGKQTVGFVALLVPLGAVAGRFIFPQRDKEKPRSEEQK